MSGAILAASDMCLIHNVIIRSLNCIYLQARNVKLEQDVTDFTTFMHAWTVLIHEHHGNEEKMFFLWLEEDIGIPNYMEKNVNQHHAFAPGFKRFEDYVSALRAGKETYSGDKVIALLDDFGSILTNHLKEEIGTFEELESMGDKINWERWNKRVQKVAVETADKVRVIIIVIIPRT